VARSQQICRKDIEPLNILKSLPGNPQPLPVRSFSDTRIELLSESFGSKQRVLEVIQEFTGRPLLAYIPLSQPQPDPSVIHAPSIALEQCIEAPSDTELVVTDITKSRWNHNKNQAEWYTTYSDGSKSWEPRESFEDVDAVTDIFREYIKIHPTPTPAPKKRGRPRKQTIPSQEALPQAPRKRGRPKGLVQDPKHNKNNIQNQPKSKKRRTGAQEDHS